MRDAERRSDEHGNEGISLEPAESVARQGADDPADGSGQGGAGEGSSNGADASGNGVPEPVEISSFADFWRFLLDKVESYWTGFLKLSPLLIVATVILLVTWLVAKAVSWVAQKVARRAGARTAIVDLAGVLAKMLVWIVGLFAAMSVVFPTITPGSLVTGAGLGAAVIGIAFKDVFENFMAGFLLLLRKAMRIGDYVECEGVEGRIERTTLRDTYLRKTDGELVLLPNSFLFKNPVHVWTDPDYRRFDIAVGVAYGEDVGEAREVIEKAVRGLDFGSGKEAQVFATGFGASSVDFTVRWWAEPEPIDQHRSRDRVIEAVKSALDGAGIEIPFPYRTLTFNEPLPIARPDDGGEGTGERTTVDGASDSGSEGDRSRDAARGPAGSD